MLPTYICMVMLAGDILSTPLLYDFKLDRLYLCGGDTAFEKFMVNCAVGCSTNSVFTYLLIKFIEVFIDCTSQWEQRPHELKLYQVE